MTHDTVVALAVLGVVAAAGGEEDAGTLPPVARGEQAKAARYAAIDAILAA